MESLDNTLAVILGGGQGTRLYPLTKERAKPAVPMAGKYRLIDIPVSNCLNSGIYKIAILTQFNSVSLHRHISQTYKFDVFHSGWVNIWAAEQTMESRDWYQGTADAVRKQIIEIRSARVPYVLILAGDHLYRMNYAEMAAFHWKKDADITVAVQPVTLQDASRFGILKMDDQKRIVRFAEKPEDALVLQEMVSLKDKKKPYLGSMGIYLFKTEALFKILQGSTFEDFGKHVLPASIGGYQVFGYYYDGYWADIGTIRSFYETNLALTDPKPLFSMIDEGWPIYTHPRFLPAAEILNSTLEHVMLAEGSWIKDACISHSVIGLRSQIRAGVTMHNTIMMGADYYGFFRRGEEEAKGEVGLGVGSNCVIEGAIIDKNARIGRDVVIKPFPRGTDLDRDCWVVRDGIVVIPKGATIQPGQHITPEEVK
jgi:glucose-1-phosphate adenylyltransferase